MSYQSLLELNKTDNSPMKFKVTETGQIEVDPADIMKSESTKRFLRFLKNTEESIEERLAIRLFLV